MVEQSAGPDIEPIYGNAYLPRKSKIGIALPEDNCDHLGWHPQGDSKFYFGINVENGRIKDEDGLRLKTGLRRLFERFRMPARLTPQQSILLCDLEPEWKEEILALLREHGIKTHEEISSVRRFAMACPALPTCGLAITESERVMRMVDELEVELAKLRLDAEPFTIRMTGCPNACARPYTADIGLVGKAVGRSHSSSGADCWAIASMSSTKTRCRSARSSRNWCLCWSTSRPTAIRVNPWATSATARGLKSCCALMPSTSGGLNR